MPIARRLLEWRKKQKRGAIMEPSTFKSIKRKAKKEGYDDPEAVAGAAYWRAARKKFAERRKK